MLSISYVGQLGVKAGHKPAFAAFRLAARPLLMTLKIAACVVSVVILAAVWTFVTMISMGGAR